MVLTLKDNYTTQEGRMGTIIKLKISYTRKNLKKQRKRIQEHDAVNILNKNVENIGLSTNALAGLKAGGFKNLKELAESINNFLPLNTLGLESRIEIQKLAKKSKIILPTNWWWR
ncbi:MAG: hypothetical protein ACOYMB_03755 [Patescibacteria group bacterium]